MLSRRVFGRPDDRGCWFCVMQLAGVKCNLHSGCFLKEAGIAWTDHMGPGCGCEGIHFVQDVGVGCIQSK